jgi:hypothetical protein
MAFELMELKTSRGGKCVAVLDGLHVSPKFFVTGVSFTSQIEITGKQFPILSLDPSLGEERLP